MKKLSVFWRFFITYLLALIIPFSAVTLFYYNQQKVLRVNMKQYYSNILTSVKNTSDTLFSQLPGIQYSIEHSVWLHNLCIENQLPTEVFSLEALTNALRALSSLQVQYPDIANISLSLEGSHSILTSTGIYQLNSPFYGQNISQTFLDSESSTSYLQYCTLTDNQETYLVFVAPFTNSYETFYVNRPKGTLNISICIDDYLERCAGQLDEQLIFQVTYNRSAAPFHLSNREPNSDLSYEQIQMPSDVLSDIQYTLSIPSDLYYNQIHTQTRLLWLSLLGIALVSLILVGLLSYFNFKPIRMLRSALPNSSDIKEGNEFSYISQGIAAIQTQYSAAQSVLRASRPYVTQSLLFNLLFERYDEELEHELKRQKIEFPFSYFCVLAAAFSTESLESSPASSAGGRTLQECFIETCNYYFDRYQFQGYLYEISIDKFGIILNFPSEASLNPFVQELSDDCVTCFRSDWNVPVLFGVGRVCQHLSELSGSFDEACHALEQAGFLSDHPVIYYDDCPHPTKQFYEYSPADEATLVCALKRGDADRALQQINHLLQYHAQDGFLNINAAKCLHYQILSTLIKTIRQLGFPIEQFADIDAISQLQDLSSIHLYLQEVCRSVCSAVFQRGDSHTGEFVNSVLQYVQTHLFEHTLSLQQVADHFKVSMPYISQIFRDKLGISYSEYVNKARIAKATELQAATQAPWTQIYEAVGYNSMSTFRRNLIKYGNHSNTEDTH